MRTIAVLGATGSIGTQTLDLARRYPERFRVNCLAANASKEKLFALVREFRPEAAALVCEPDEIPEDLRFCEWFFGHDACVNALKAAQSQDALCAIVGIAGLDAVLAAAISLSRAEAARLINQGRALVNQAETLRVDYTVPEHALLSLRGTGRVRLDEIAGETKKGRIALRLFVYGGGK